MPPFIQLQPFGISMRTTRPVQSILKYLPAFEAAVRLGSFTLAGKEIGLTQSAISRRIKDLEDRLGCRLFLRSHRLVQVSPAGRRLYDAYAYTAQHLSDVVADLTPPKHRDQLVLTTSTAIATFWLMPKVAELRDCFPGAQIFLVTADPLGIEHTPSIYGSLVFGESDLPGMKSRRLFRDVLSPICTPDYLDTHGPLERPRDLLSVELLHMEAQHPTWLDWSTWFRKNGLDMPAGKRMLRFNNYYHVIQACLAGQGMALGWLRLVRDHIRDRTLLTPLNMRTETDAYYHLTVQEDHAKDWDPDPFFDWIMN